MASLNDRRSSFLKPGATLASRYRIEEMIGAGGFSEIFAAYDTETKRRCAIKALSIARAGDERSLNRAKREGPVLAQLRHPNVVHCFDYGERPDGLVWIAMDLLIGRNLRGVMEGFGGKIPFPVLLQIMAQASAGLEAIHTLRLIHRDLKPENIHVDVEGTVRMLDLGIVKLAANEHFSSVAGVVAGTPAYFSPEQTYAEQLTPVSDVFSMGTIMFECLWGKNPFTVRPDGTPIEKMQWGVAICSPNRPPMVSTLEPSVPTPFAVFLAQVLGLGREGRPSSALSLARFCEGALRNWERDNGPAEPLGAAMKRLQAKKPLTGEHPGVQPTNNPFALSGNSDPSAISIAVDRTASPINTTSPEPPRVQQGPHATELMPVTRAAYTPPLPLVRTPAWAADAKPPSAPAKDDKAALGPRGTQRMSGIELEALARGGPTSPAPTKLGSSAQATLPPAAEATPLPAPAPKPASMSPVPVVSARPAAPTEKSEPSPPEKSADAREPCQYRIPPFPVDLDVGPKDSVDLRFAKWIGRVERDSGNEAARREIISHLIVDDVDLRFAAAAQALFHADAPMLDELRFRVAREPDAGVRKQIRGVLVALGDRDMFNLRGLSPKQRRAHLAAALACTIEERRKSGDSTSGGMVKIPPYAEPPNPLGPVATPAPAITTAAQPSAPSPPPITPLPDLRAEREAAARAAHEEAQRAAREREAREQRLLDDRQAAARVSSGAGHSLPVESVRLPLERVPLWLRTIGIVVLTASAVVGVGALVVDRFFPELRIVLPFGGDAAPASTPARPPVTAAPAPTTARSAPPAASAPPIPTASARKK
jgi:serine/threonine protein kinase